MRGRSTQMVEEVEQAAQVAGVLREPAGTEHAHHGGERPTPGESGVDEAGPALTEARSPDHPGDGDDPTRELPQPRIGTPGAVALNAELRASLEAEPSQEAKT